MTKLPYTLQYLDFLCRDSKAKLIIDTGTEVIYEIFWTLGELKLTRNASQVVETSALCQ